MATGHRFRDFGRGELVDAAPPQTSSGGTCWIAWVQYVKPLFVMSRTQLLAWGGFGQSVFLQTLTSVCLDVQL